MMMDTTTETTTRGSIKVHGDGDESDKVLSRVDDDDWDEEGDDDDEGTTMNLATREVARKNSDDGKGQ